MRPRQLSVLAAAALLALSCRGAAHAPTPLPAAAPSHQELRVLMLSLDGASAIDLHRLYREGKLDAGGFARFFREGQVADDLVPVDPTITAVNHISLATGHVPGETGIVSNTFHPAGSPAGKTVSGFAAPIETETLWEAARRQGKNAGVATWPGADAKDARRTADWGLVYVNDPDRKADLVLLKRSDWTADARPLAAGLASHSPVLAARVSAGDPAEPFDLLALDTEDDGRTAYDSLAIVPLAPPGERMPETRPQLLRLGQWGDPPCAVPGGVRACPVKVLALDPGLADVRLYFGGIYPLIAYPETFSKELWSRHLQWPGPPDDHRLDDALAGQPGIDLETWAEQSERFAEFFGDSLLAAIGHGGWDLLMGYFPVIDEAGHHLLLVDPRQPGFTPERRDADERVRLRAWQAVDRQLARLLTAVDLRRTVVVVVSDHGMAPVHTGVDLNALLRSWGFHPDAFDVYAVNAGGVSNVYVSPDLPDREKVLADLRSRFASWKVDGHAPIEQVVPRAEAGPLGLDNPSSGDLILFANLGYTFREGKQIGDHPSFPTNVYGMHGNRNTHPEMHGIFLAVGAGVKPGNAGTVRNPEVASRVAAWLGIEPPRLHPVSPQ
jgi:predicted AlkP superfamily pyrophosphatase or phosphodiesterase